MKKALLSAGALLLLLLAITTTACRKDSATSADQATAEDILAYNDLTELVDADADVALNGFTSGAVDDRSDCPTVSSSQPIGTWPNTITLDYSEAGCTKDGRTYKGKILITQTGPIGTVGTTRTFTFEGFSVEGVQIEGSRTVTNIGLNADGQPTRSVTANETLTFPDGSQATHQTNRSRSLVQGAGTDTRVDDIWEITGTATGTTRNGVAYTVSITTPLVRRPLCPWISEGVVEFTANNKTRTLNFGDGTCDRDAVLTLADGTEKEVKIRRRWWV